MILRETKSENITRREIEAKLSSVGDYVKMDYLQACLKKQLDFDTKKFVLLKLSEIYESRKLFVESGRMMRNAAEINTTFEGKMNDFSKSFELFLTGGDYANSEISFAKALGCATELQKQRLKTRRKEIFKKQADDYIKKDKRKHAMDLYERYLEFDLSPNERKEAQDALLGLYEKLGKVKEYLQLRKGGSNPKPAPEVKSLRDDKKDEESFFREIGL